MKKIVRLKDVDPMIFAGISDNNLKFIETNFNAKIISSIKDSNELLYPPARIEIPSASFDIE